MDHLPRDVEPGRRCRAAPIAAVALGGLLVVSATACGDTAGLPDSVTTQGDEVASLWKVFLGGAVLMTLLIWGLTTFVVVAAIRRRRTEAVDEVPVQHQTRIGLEIAYTTAPLVIVAVLLALTFGVQATVTDTSAPAQVKVVVTGFQWQWQFDYPDRRITVAGAPDVLPELWLPVGQTIRFEVSAPDVIHSFWVPEFLQKRDMIPGVTNVIQIDVDRTGQWIGRCAEYCGFNHWAMKFVVCAVAPAEFEAWATEIAARPQPVVAGQRIDVASGTTAPAAGSRPCPSLPGSDIGFADSASGGDR